MGLNDLPLQTPLAANEMQQTAGGGNLMTAWVKSYDVHSGLTVTSLKGNDSVYDGTVDGSDFNIWLRSSPRL
ncbi:MAG: hypothetical protein AAGG11_04305 [Pseudomonadota bacterium]